MNGSTESPATILTPRDWQSHSAYLSPGYKSTVKRSPTRPLLPLKAALGELSQPVYGHDSIAALDHDLTRNARRNGEPIGERMVLAGRVVDERGRPVRNTLVELWQANASGRYVHKVDQHDAPLDPNFLGAGRCLTDDEGRYRFLTIKPGAYPWGNHHNAWRPAHIHFSLFGTAFTQRLVTQMYFPGDPLFALDPIYNSIHRQKDRDALVGVYDHDLTSPEWATGYRFDIVVDGPDATYFEQEGE